MALAEAGRMEDAERIFAMVSEARDRLLGAGHPDSESARRNLELASSLAGSGTGGPSGPGG
ncbi:MAG: hypothetical protein LBT40_14725 [Deltaproteobacteria bacterium]|nr:hypothetical protein [Deltaproteobacteria bacterium]